MHHHERYRIVLVETSHPGNIGAVARAMKTMGLEDLVLVAPKSFPHEHANARAAGAEDILEQAVQCDQIEQALTGCHRVYGASARLRHDSIPQYTPHTLATHCQYDQHPYKTAILFGNERSGLDNAALSYCHGQVIIPTALEFSSLNLAAAVQIITYELYINQTLEPRTTSTVALNPAATGDQMAYFFQHLDHLLTDLKFSTRIDHHLTVNRLRRLFSRAQPEKDEIDLLQGILSRFDRLLPSKDDS